MGLPEDLGFRSSRVLVNGISLHVVENGSGPMVIMLHGWPEFWYSWKHALSQLSGQYHVVAPDMRGYNLSDKPEGISPYSLKNLVNDVLGLIDHFGVDQVHLVGHDWGGIVAWQFAIQHPDRIKDLVILNCPHPEAFRQALKKDIRQRMKSWYMLFFQVPALPEFILSSSLPFFFRRIFLGWMRQPDAFNAEDILHYVQSYRKPGALKASLNYYRALFSIGPPRTDRFRVPIPKPILVLWGLDDKVLGHSMTRDMDRFAGKGFRQVDFKNCSHWIQHEYPERVHAEMITFWESHQ